MIARGLLGLGLLLGGCASSSGDDGSGGSTGAPRGTSTGAVDGSTDGEAPTSGAVETGGSTTDGPMDETTSTSSDATSTGATTDAGSSATGESFDPCPRVRVTVAPGDTLNVRPTPATDMAPVGMLASGMLVDVLDIVQGQEIDGVDTWYEIDGPNVTGYVFGGFVECTQDALPTDGFFLPLGCGTTATVSQGNFGEFSHQDEAAYAFDFALPLGTPMVAIADGVVSHLYDGTLPEDPCYDGGGMECVSKANFVTLQHPDGTASVYLHLSEVEVAVEQVVPRGSVVGLSGASGWSTGPHAHVARQEACGLSYCQSIAVMFADVPDDGVPQTGDSVTSQNCP